MPELILESDWEDYDNKKIIGKADSSFFSCTEEWEVAYLMKKIFSHYPFYTQEEILAAIKSCCAEINAPRPRHEFIHCVMSKL